jgi:hypothetical protein
MITNSFNDVAPALVESFDKLNRAMRTSILLNDWAQMFTQGVINNRDVLRVEVNEDDTVNILDFTLPTISGRTRHNIPQEDVPTWVMESISMLRIAQEGDLVPELGFKVSDTLYYILDRTGEVK